MASFQTWVLAMACESGHLSSMSAAIPASLGHVAGVCVCVCVCLQLLVSTHTTDAYLHEFIQLCVSCHLFNLFCHIKKVSCAL